MLAHDVDLDDVQSKLTDWIKEKMPQAENLSISDMERSGAGFTNVSLSFTLSWQESGEQKSEGMLFRGAGKSDPVYPDPKLEQQFRVMKCLENTNVPVPKVFWLEMDERLFGFSFYLMERLAGVVPSEFPPYHSFGICYDCSPAQREKMWWNAIDAMAEIHKLDWKSLGLSFLGVPAEGTGPIDRELEYYNMYLNWTKGEPQPVLEATYKWLCDNKYAPDRVTLCWGDARFPNIMFTPEGEVLGVLDWDMAVVSDPVSDLSFIISLDWLLSEGTDIPRLEGFPGKEETIARYEKLTGWKVSNYFYNEVFSTFRSSVVILRVQKILQKMGIDLPGDDPIVDNFCTQRLADLLGLPAPGASKKKAAKNEALSGTVQFHITGPGGEEWFIVVDKGEAVRHEGSADNPDVRITVTAEDWAAIVSGEMNRFNAWTSGKMNITGDTNLYQKLSDTIAKVTEVRSDS
jgi:aminoglycoside phosphotransferase (APT) family kinase protein/putative sterol carrier protein